MLVAKGKLKDIPLKEDDKGRIEELSASLKAAIEAKENAKTNDDKIASTVAIENARVAIKQVCACICMFIFVYIPIHFRMFICMSLCMHNMRDTTTIVNCIFIKSQLCIKSMFLFF